MYNGIVLFDVDGTLINQKYDLTIPEPLFQEHVRRAKDAGLVLGLSSDKPLEPLQRFAGRVSFNGPIVAEKGGVVDLRDGSVPPQLTLPETQPFGALRSRIIDALARQSDGWFVGAADADGFPHWVQKLPPGRPGDVAVCINPYRRISFSCWIRGWVNGGWNKDEGTTNRVLDCIMETGKGLGSLWLQRDVDVNHAYGVIIIHHRSMRKALGLKPLRDTYPGVPITMVGDSVTDWLDDDEIEQMAVANASPEYRTHCAWVAPSEVTAGAIEVLDRIKSRYV